MMGLPGPPGRGLPGSKVRMSHKVQIEMLFTQIVKRSNILFVLKVKWWAGLVNIAFYFYHSYLCWLHVYC